VTLFYPYQFCFKKRNMPAVVHELIEPIHSVHASRATLERLLTMIQEGYWKPGERLPAQRKLAGMLGISMSTLREALQSLQSVGILEMRQGEGTFVSQQPYQTIERVLGLSFAQGVLNIQSLFEARIFIESGLAYHAARRASTEQLEALFGDLKELEQAIRQDRMRDAEDLDLAFHRRISEMAGNIFLKQVWDMLHHVMEQYVRIIPHTLEGHRLHVKIAEAIRDRHPDASAQAVRKLIESTQARYTAYLNQSNGNHH
jgi:GntR family transcriptional repressor for pyruvate dehydrogenase complex